jgi:hypothetical protein
MLNICINGLVNIFEKFWPGMRTGDAVVEDDIGGIREGRQKS